MKKNARSSDLLLEIGTEELPAAYLPGLIEQLGAEAKALLAANHLAFKQVESFGTPRRLVLFVRGLEAIQRKPAEEIRGPSKQAAYDAAGNPTQALQGFLRSQGGQLEQLKIVSSGKGEYVYLIKPETEVSINKWLTWWPGLLIQWLRAPKTMHWDDSNLRFARPIRWMLALYGTQPIRCYIGNLTSALRTRIGRPQAMRETPVASIPSYFQTLKRVGIILDQEKRRQRIGQLVGREAKRAGGVIAPEMISHGLLEEVTNLVEQPFLLAGDFDRKYLDLPREVLLASMAKHQRVFAVEANGKLLPRWIAILDGKPRKPNEVRKTYEFILNARLADSLLFWNQDHRHLPLDTFGSMAGVTLHEKLGSMEDKTRRMNQLSGALADVWQLTDVERRQLERACLLAKQDLISTMVKEFPTLQGIVGKYYARDSHEPEAVAEAIGEQYLPAGSDAPKTLLGRGLALIEKYDTLASYFAIDIMPTGDQDPFGLRRAAQGIVEIAWSVHRPLTLDALWAAWQASAPFAKDKPVGVKIRSYLQERFYTFDWPAPAPSRDLIDAVLSSASDDLVDTMDRIRALRQMDGAQALVRAAKIVERTANILKGTTPQQADVDRARLQEPLEQQLYALYESKKDEFARLVERRSYDDATKLFAETFYTPLHEFFDKVMVNVPDEALRQNRLALMKAINVLYTDRIADLSKLAVLQPRQLSASPIVLNHERS